jgi:hypothetical protein
VPIGVPIGAVIGAVAGPSLITPRLGNQAADVTRQFNALSLKNVTVNRYAITGGFVYFIRRHDGIPFNSVELVDCNIEIDSEICYQSACLEQPSDCRGLSIRNCKRECARGCCAPVTDAARG